MTITNATADAGPAITHDIDMGLVPPAVRHIDIEGVRCVAVSLTGEYGFGREMLLDEADWNIIKEITPWWSVARMSGNEYVNSGVSKAAEIARQSAKSNMLFLARHLAQPGPKEVVRYRNGNHLDLTRGNLRVVSRTVLSRENVVTRLRRTHERAAAIAADASAGAA